MQGSGHCGFAYSTDVSVLYYHDSNMYGSDCHIDVICHIRFPACFTDMCIFPSSMIHCSLKGDFDKENIITQRPVGSSQTRGTQIDMRHQTNTSTWVVENILYIYLDR